MWKAAREIKWGTLKFAGLDTYVRNDEMNEMFKPMWDCMRAYG